MESFHFSVNGKWKGDRNGAGSIQTNGMSIDVSAPKELDGPGSGSNPEELLTSAANNCYMITLAAMLSNRKIELDHFEVVSEAQVDRIEGKLQFKQIIHKPVMYMKAGSDVSSEKLEELAIRAEKACFISKTLRGNVEVSVEPKVISL
ncbi:MAG: OsmC family protein [Bacillota bacterium]|nr:OsmC family protein [Bacillota bacterium]